MGRGSINQGDARSLLYGTRARGSGPELIEPEQKEEFERLRQGLKKGRLPHWLKDAGFTASGDRRSFVHPELNDEMVVATLQGPKEELLELSVCLDNGQPSIAFSYDRQENQGPGLGDEERLILLLDKRLDEPAKIEFTIENGGQCRRLIQGYPSGALNALSLAPPSFTDLSNEDERLSDLAELVETEESARLLREARTLKELAHSSGGPTALAEACEEATVYLAADLHRFAAGL